MFVLAGGLLLMTAFGQKIVEQMAFFPESGVQADLAAFSADIETVYLTTADGVKISAFWLPRPDTRRAVLYFHGNAGNASHRLPDAVELWSRGMSVLLLDYRGYGLSDGRPTEKGIYLDGEAGLKYLTDDLDYRLEEVVVLGRSIGSTVAVHVARDRPLAGVVLVSPLSSGRDVAKQQGLGLFIPLIGHPFDNLAKITRVASPVMVLHGAIDDVLNPGMGERLHAAAPNGRGFYLLAGRGHNDISSNNPQYFELVTGFIAEVGPTP